jgi:hypothetical protein
MLEKFKKRIEAEFGSDYLEMINDFAKNDEELFEFLADAYIQDVKESMELITNILEK